MTDEGSTAALSSAEPGASPDPTQRAPARKSSIGRWLRRATRSTSERRLAESLPPFEIELKRRGSGAEWARTAQELLDAAKRAWADGDMECSWGLFLAATRMEIFGYEDREAKVRRMALLREADEKLRSWRGEAIRDALGAEGSAVDLDALYWATFLRDEDAANGWRRMALLRRQLLVLAGIMVLSLFAVLALAVWAPVRLAESPDSVDARIWAYAAAFGTLGGCLSAARSITSSRGRRVPEKARDLWLTAARPLVGAAAGVAALVVLGSDLETTGPLLGLAFAAGFSEQLLARAVDAAGGRAEDEGRPQATDKCEGSEKLPAGG